MRYNLAQLTRRTRNPRRSAIVLRDIVPPATLATDLYRSVYVRVVATWERAAPGIIAEYERTLSVMTTDSPADLQARLDAASSDIERLFILLDASLRDWATRVESWQRGRWRGAVLSATGVDILTLIGPEDMRETLGAYIAWNTRLVRNVSDQIAEKIGNAVFAGLQNGTPAREVGKAIADATGFARKRSKAIAADQLSKIAASLAAERRREAGLSVYKFRHSGKRHPRQEHVARNGKLYAETGANAGIEVNGQIVNPPIERGDRAGQPPFCGCREQGVLILE